MYTQSVYIYGVIHTVCDFSVYSVCYCCFVSLTFFFALSAVAAATFPCTLFVVAMLCVPWVFIITMTMGRYRSMFVIRFFSLFIAPHEATVNDNEEQHISICFWAVVSFAFVVAGFNIVFSCFSLCPSLSRSLFALLLSWLCKEKSVFFCCYFLFSRRFHDTNEMICAQR